MSGYAESSFVHRDVAGNVLAAYTAGSRSTSTASLYGSWNLALDQSNWLVLANTANTSSRVSIRVVNPRTRRTKTKTYTVGARKGLKLALHNTATFGTSFSAYGPLRVSVTSGSIVADLLRTRQNPANSADLDYSNLLQLR